MEQMQNRQEKTAAQEDENPFFAIFHANPDPLSIIRLADCRYTHVNSSFCSLFALTPDQALGRTARELNLWHHPDSSEQLIETIRAQRRVDDVELQFHAPAGNTGFLLISAQIFVLAGEECILYTGHDITARKQLEHARQEQIDFLTQVINTMSEGLAITNVNRQFEVVNPAFASLLGYHPDQLIGKMPLDITAAEDADAVNHARQQRLHGEITRLETHLIHNNKSFVPVLASSSPRMKDGQYAGTISVFTDLTGIKRAEKLRHESEDRFNKAFRASPIGICIIRLSDGFPVDANTAFLSMIGYSHEELSARSVKGGDYFTDTSQIENWLDTLYNEGFVHNAETTVRTRSGEICHLLFSIESFKMEGEALVMLLCVDITGRKQAAAALLAGQVELEQRVQQRTAELQAANHELETLVRSMAHDLRTPLRAIAGYSHLLEENASNQLDEDSHHAIQRMKAGAGRMGQLIDGLMDFIHLRRQTIHKGTVDTRSLVQEVLNELLSPAEKTRKITVSIADLPPCTADIKLLHIVFTNLLENALKYTALCPQAVIEVGMQDGAYFVRDNGVGFETQYAEKIFGIFERLHRVDEFEGTGIGLAIVKRIIDRHGGRIWAEAEIGKGAAFHFTLE